MISTRYFSSHISIGGVLNLSVIICRLSFRSCGIIVIEAGVLCVNAKFSYQGSAVRYITVSLVEIIAIRDQSFIKFPISLENHR